MLWKTCLKKKVRHVLFGSRPALVVYKSFLPATSFDGGQVTRDTTISTINEEDETEEEPDDHWAKDAALRMKEDRLNVDRKIRTFSSFN